MSNFTILIVDDTITNIELLTSILEDVPYDVRVATSGEAALRSLDVKLPDLILLDIMMPGLDGYQTCAQIKSNPRTSNIPVIFLSAKDKIEDKVKAFEVGGIDYIVKPFHSKEVLVRVHTHLSIHKLQYELQEKIRLIDDNIITSETTPEGIITQVSQALCNISGYTKEELIGQSHQILRHPDMPRELYKELWSTIQSGQIWEGEIKNIAKNKEYYWVKATISPKRDANGLITGYRSFRQVITDHKRVQELSITDGLTHLYNRRYFNEVLPKEIKRSLRQGEMLSFLMLDVDHFKRYNDTYGHQAGDAVLEQIGNALQTQFKRGEDFVFRLGGEEFGVIYIAQNVHNSRNIAQELCARIEALKIPHQANDVSAFVTASIGVVILDGTQPDASSLDEAELYKQADQALYRAKENGRNQVSFQ